MILRTYIVTKEWEEPGGGCDCSGEWVEYDVDDKIVFDYALRFAERDFKISTKLLRNLIVELDLEDKLIEYYEEEIGDYCYERDDY